MLALVSVAAVTQFSAPVYPEAQMTPEKSAVPVGIIAAMPSEARALGVSGPFNQIVELDDHTLLYVCGVGPENARRATTALLAAGAGGLVSWGIAGGLIANLSPGTLLLAASVVCADAAYETDSDWVSRLSQRITSILQVSHQSIYSGGLLVSSAAEKKQLADESGAVAVDMESGVIAEAAVAAGVPFVCIRVIADPASFSLPSTLGAAINDDGFVSIELALRALARRPGEIVSMLQLALHFRRATKGLALISRVVGPRLLGP